MKKHNKKSGLTLIELLIYISIISITYFIISNNFENTKQKKEFSIQKREISQFIRKIQQYAQHNKQVYIFDFKLSEEIIYFRDSNKNIIDKMKLSKNISYMTNNKEKNVDFVRNTTIEGNFERGFSIYLLNKKGNKIYYRISTNTINAAKYPIISIYKAKKEIDMNSDYSKPNLWEEEL